MAEYSKGIAVMRLMKQVMDAFRHIVGDRFKPMNLTVPQGMLIGTLKRLGKMKVSDLSEQLGLSNSTVSGILDRLENQGLVTRTRSKEDRRVVYVNITEEFQKNSQEHFSQMEAHFGELMSKATDEELDTIIKGLEVLKRIFERQED